MEPLSIYYSPSRNDIILVRPSEFRIDGLCKAFAYDADTFEKRFNEFFNRISPKDNLINSDYELIGYL